MFGEAVKKVSKFTFPVIISKLLFNGKVECSCATFVVLNKEGWILTAAHVIKEIENWDKNILEVKDYEKKKKLIEDDSKLHYKEKDKKIKKIPYDESWVRNYSYHWGIDGLQVKTFNKNDLKDIAFGKLEPYDPNMVSEYPKFINPKSELLTGTSLCKLGYPLHNINGKYDYDKNIFAIDPSVLPLPRFPIDGIYTRNKVIIHQASGNKAMFIETSSPGLRGQSGGPIFDSQGNIWGLQSHTHHFPLGFSPTLKQGHKDIVEHQFINVGLGVHVQEIVSDLTQFKINFELSE